MTSWQQGGSIVRRNLATGEEEWHFECSALEGNYVTCQDSVEAEFSLSTNGNNLYWGDIFGRVIALAVDGNKDTYCSYTSSDSPSNRTCINLVDFACDKFVESVGAIKDGSIYFIGKSDIIYKDTCAIRDKCCSSLDVLVNKCKKMIKIEIISGWEGREKNLNQWKKVVRQVNRLVKKAKKRCM